MNVIVDIHDKAAVTHEVVGGKGCNLGRLAGLGFAVPEAFVVSTDAYRTFVSHADLTDSVRAASASFDYSDAGRLEEQASALRAKFEAAEVPVYLRDAIVEAYRSRNQGGLVAVRSSGTAEDLADASFAGQHDTYLDIRGEDELIDAVRRCWASLWTTRAVAYRHRGGYDHESAALAVVVQQMIDADVSGVLFTANPFAELTDEIVVNSSWGLGEAIVSGITNPDQFRLAKADLKVRERTMGAKEVTIRRDPDRDSGVVESETPADRREVWSLTDTELAELGELGRRIEAAYQGMPQDIEWAMLDGQLHVLQSRDVTGFEPSWDEDVDAWQHLEGDPDAVWSRAFADEFWTGAVSPLFYSIRAREFTECHERINNVWGFQKLARIRRFRYLRGEIYLSLENESEFVRNTVPVSWRPGAMGYFPDELKQDAMTWDFSLAGYLRMHARILGLDRDQGPQRWLDVLNDYIENRVDEATGLPDEEIAKLSDDALEKFLQKQIVFETDLLYAMWSGFFVHAAAALNLLGMLLAKWYDGDNPHVFADLISGLPKRTKTLEENILLWELATAIREDTVLSELLATTDSHEEFFGAVTASTGSSAGKLYAQLLEEHGHRGNADRDFYYPRRSDDTTVDFGVLKALSSAREGTDPIAKEHEKTKVREDAFEDVTASLRRKPFGSVRVELFRVLMGYVDKFLVIRDDERHFIDRSSYSQKRALAEVGRRLVDRGCLVESDDFYFLTQTELFDMLHRGSATRLDTAKIRGRRRNFEQFDRKEEIPPLYVVGNHEAEEYGEEKTPVDGALVGLGTSKGSITGTARVVRQLKDIGRVRQGDILITNSTDPSWTPVFMIISGLVLETGGMLAHGSCLSREYSLPAVTIPNAANRIPDGATITVHGSTGQVVLHEDEAAIAAVEAAEDVSAGTQ